MKEEFEKLGILNIKDYFEFVRDNFRYGWVDNNGVQHLGVNDAATYSLQSPIEILKSRIGICWDLTELSRSFFEVMTDLKFETYYIFYDDNAGCPSHTFLVFYENDKVYWFEPMYNDNSIYYAGIHEFTDIKELIMCSLDIFMRKQIFEGKVPIDYNKNAIYVYKFNKFSYHINGYDVRNCINASEKVEVSYDRKSL